MASASGHGVFLKNLSVSFVQLKDRETSVFETISWYDSARVRDHNTEASELMEVEDHHYPLLVSLVLKQRTRIAN